MSYVVITPVRNEAARFAQTIASVVAQKIRPLLWVIVNDGSADETGALADEAALAHHWIRVVHRKDRGFRKQGGGVIESFYEGYTVLSGSLMVESPSPKNGPQWEFIGKLDGDLAFEPDYFEKCLAHFEKNPKLGIAGGTICRRSGEALIVESNGDPAFHVRGAVKLYRRACWEQIGGLVSAPGWDTIDELKANMLGWETRTLDDLKVHQLKDTGSADGAWRNWVKNGRANYVTGYHPLFMAAKCVKRLFARPVVVGAVGLAWGYVQSCLGSDVKQTDDTALVSYVRKQQWRALTLRSSIWD